MIKRALSLIIAAAMLSGIPVYADEGSYGAISDDVTLGYSAELLDTDDMTKGSGADWGTWDSSTHTLTLMGDLPDMNEGMLYRYVNNIAVIEKIVILPETKAAGSLKSAFKGLTALKEIEGLSELDTSSVTNMSYVFSGCESLLSLDLSGWDTSEVTTMIGMFAGCSSVTSLKLPAGFSVTTAMQLPNNTGGYIGWAKSGTNTVISKSGRFAEFAAPAKGEYIRITEQVHQHTYSAPVYLWGDNYTS
ncbi:MAG: BspA family leucine-rich repeat surface protein [Oscillospiraceae bacterium]|nr:BspA family leucine-rich repeat surface protein [Oscillospiraceae bacterium]